MSDRPKCQDCGQTFASKRNLKKHRERFHPTENYSEVSSPRSVDGENESDDVASFVVERKRSASSFEDSEDSEASGPSQKSKKKKKRGKNGGASGGVGALAFIDSETKESRKKKKKKKARMPIPSDESSSDSGRVIVGPGFGSRADSGAVAKRNLKKKKVDGGRGRRRETRDDEDESDAEFGPRADSDAIVAKKGKKGSPAPLSRAEATKKRIAFIKERKQKAALEAVAGSRDTGATGGRQGGDQADAEIRGAEHQFGQQQQFWPWGLWNPSFYQQQGQFPYPGGAPTPYYQPMNTPWPAPAPYPWYGLQPPFSPFSPGMQQFPASDPRIGVGRGGSGMQQFPGAAGVVQHVASDPRIGVGGGVPTSLTTRDAPRPNRGQRPPVPTMEDSGDTSSDAAARNGDSDEAALNELLAEYFTVGANIEIPTMTEASTSTSAAGAIAPSPIFQLPQVNPQDICTWFPAAN